MKNGLYFVAACAMSFSAFADVWVDCNTLSATHDGTKDHPYLTIQEGVVACPVGETVWVEPGLYGAAGAVESPDGHHSVVSISKAITVASTGGKFRTVIQGKKSAASSGLGSDAVRCVYIGSDAAAVIKGFTLTDGYSDARNSGSDTDANRGGGVLCSTKSGDANNVSSTAAFIVDCIITGCKAQRGGGLHGSSAVRCLVYNTSAVSSGPAERNANTYNCVFYKIAGGNLFHGTHVNTTVITPGTGDQATTGAPKCYNCLFMGPGTIHSGVSSSQKPQYYNCVVNTTMDKTNPSIDVSQSEYVTWSNSQVDADGAVYEIARLDFRSVSALQGVTPAGDASYLSKIPEAYRDTDFNGNPLPTSGACYAGAAQGAFAAQPTAATFPVQRNDPKKGVFFVDGRPVWFDGDVHFDAPYVTVTGQGVGEYRFVTACYATSGSVFIPDMADNKVLFTPAAGATAKDDKLTVEFQRPIWADAVSGNDATADGTEAKPFKTLQAACDKACENNDTRLVLAKPGDYNEGGKSSNDLFSRLGLSSKVYVRSTDGAAVTFISGESDTTSGQADAYGNGPDAVRCLAVPQAAGGSVQGFTLRNGRTSTVAGGGKANRGGAICLGFASMYLGTGTGMENCPTVADCVITGCDGVQGVVSYGYLKRCRFTGNVFHGSGKTLVMQAWMEGCLFDNNEAAVATCSICAGSTHAINCTFTKNIGFVNLVGNSSVMLLNSISYRNGCNDLNSASVATNCLYATGVLGTSASGCLRGYPCFIDYGEDDFRLAEVSPAFGLGVTDYLFSGALDDKNPKDTWAFCDMTGVDGVSLFAADGSLTAGACGSRMPYVQKVVYVTPTGAGKKDGSSWEDACASIQTGVDAATDTADFCGLRDRVTVAAGRYETGSRLSGKPGTDEPVLQARLVCEKEVEIVSEAGADETFIVGAADTTSGQADKNGNGPDAVRCVYMSAGLLKGFTLVDGHSALQTTTTPTVNDEGGAFYGGGTVEDCVVSNCWAVRAGAARGGTWRNCRFSRCGATQTASYFRYPTLLEQCYFGTYSAGAPAVAGATEIDGCTFDCGYSSNADVLSDCLQVARTLFRTGRVNADKGAVMDDCAFSSEVTFLVGDGKTLTTNGCLVGELRLDAHGMPVRGACVAIDALALDAYDRATDLAGNLRVSNGAPDIGCFEYDWRGDYAQAVYPRRFAVDAASSATVLTPEGVLVRDGALEGAWLWKNNGSSATMKYAVTGTGTLYVYLGDTLVNTATAASGAQTTDLAGDAGERSAVKFVYEPGASDVGGALIARADYQGGGMIMVVR